MSCTSGSFRYARLLLRLPPAFRTAVYQQHCLTRCPAKTPARLVSSSSNASTAGGRGVIQTKSHATARKPVLPSKPVQKPTHKLQRTGYANHLDTVTGRGSRHQQPILLYKAPPQTNYYIAVGFMTLVFGLGATGCISTISAGYENREALWWQLPSLGVATGISLWFCMSSSTAARKLIHELWLLPRAPGASVTSPRLVEIRCKAWPLPVGKDTVWTAPLESMTLSRTYGSMFYGTERERGGRHSIAANMGDEAAEFKRLEQQERKQNGMLVNSLLGAMERTKNVVSEARQVLHWHGLNAWLVVEGQGSFKLDGRGLMLQGGRGLDLLFAQYKG